LIPYRYENNPIFKNMNTLNISIPNTIGYLSEWSTFDATLPNGKIIVNKIICGCGMTDYYLTNNIPVILASPRRELILSKTKNPRTSHAYYFDRSSGSVQDSLKALDCYMSNVKYRCVPKIMTTYDSLHHVIDYLERCGILQMFTIVGDEMTCLFTDAKMKGAKSMDILKLIDHLPNRCVFITATPLKEVYLDNMPVFKNMTYVSLEWDPQRMSNVVINKQKMVSTVNAIGDIIDQYRHLGYFQTIDKGGQTIYSREAVFFVNSVHDIINVIKAKKLTMADTLIVCADDASNIKELKKVNMKRGHFNDELTYKQQNKTFTFATKCSFEGADLYSDTASIYIFANPNRENLALDISIDLPQIIGRCRTKDNPFRHIIRYYYRTTDQNNFDYNMELDKIQCKYNATQEILKDNLSPSSLKMIKAGQVNYTDNYVDVIEDASGTPLVVMNDFVYIADIRSIEIKEYQYNNNSTVFQYLNDNGYKTYSYSQQMLGGLFEQFYTDFCNADTFEEKMRIYAIGCDSDIQIRRQAEANVDIPICFKRYYDVLGSQKCAELNYTETKIEQAYTSLSTMDMVRLRLDAKLPKNQWHTNKFIKKAIQEAYIECGINQTAKATDLSKYYTDLQTAQIKDENNKRIHAQKIN
jgi:hypothetical protein